MSDRRDDRPTDDASPRWMTMVGRDPRRLDPRPISPFTDSASSLASHWRAPTGPVPRMTMFRAPAPVAPAPRDKAIAAGLRVTLAAMRPRRAMDLPRMTMPATRPRRAMRAVPAKGEVR